MLKNYTSSVPAVTSINKIENKLVVHGAKNISKLYKDKKLAGLAFTMPVGSSELSFRLPSRVDNVATVMKAEIKRPKPGTFARIEAQAERTAWKILSDWVDIQMSLIELQQVEFVEVFMPYAYDHLNDETYYEKVKKGDFKQLTYNGGK
jgi:hypothetical protein